MGTAAAVRRGAVRCPSVGRKGNQFHAGRDRRVSTALALTASPPNRAKVARLRQKEPPEQRVTLLANRGGGRSRTQDLTSSPTNTCTTRTEQNRANSKHSRALADSGSGPQEQRPAFPIHYDDTSVRPENVPSMYGDGAVLPPDLAQVVASWARLPAEVKARIVAMATATGHEEGLPATGCRCSK
jgi:hypothetical protein